MAIEMMSMVGRYIALFFCKYICNEKYVLLALLLLFSLHNVKTKSTIVIRERDA